MRFSSLSLRFAALGLALGSAALSLPAQTFAAAAGTATTLGGNFNATSPSALPSHHKKTDAPLIYARVRNGIYSVDGMVGKVQLNYDVQGANFLYLFIPGVGTALVSLAPSPDAIASTGFLDKNELTLTVDGHRLNLTGVESLVSDNGKAPTKLFVHLDRDSWQLSRRPQMGFGMTASAPFEWPGALPADPASAQAEAVIPAPVPVSLLPKRVPTQPAVSSLH